MDKQLKQYPPELQEQITWVAAYIVKLRENMATDKQDWMEEDLRYQKAIYQSLCMAKWMVETCTRDLLNMPGNQPPAKCWVPFYIAPGQWTIVLVERGVTSHRQHHLGTVETEAQAIDWAENENFSDFGIEDKETVAVILEGTVFEKEVHHG